MAFVDIAMLCVLVREQFLLVPEANIMEHDIKEESFWTICWVKICESCDLIVCIYKVT
jgi:hypothetical protein